ncbi:MAG: Hsp20/alpha crystallin family protein [Methanomassiliicoccales archaeon]
MIRRRDRERDKSVVPRDYWSPTALMEDMERMFDDFRLGMRDFWPSFVRAGPRVPAMDLRDEGDKYIIEAELPGIRKEDLEIEVTETGLKLQGEHKEEKEEEEEEGYLRKERGYVSFYREMPLPEDVNRDEIEASLNDGILEVKLPKKEKPEEKRNLIEVK